MTYSEKLQDPRWQKVRLKVFERDEFVCLCCGRHDQTLHVHHLVYSGSNPWDAPLETLETLCRGCHGWREEFNSYARGRTTIPTKFCFAAVMFATTNLEIKVKLSDLGNFFAGYWKILLAKTTIRKEDAVRKLDGLQQ